MTLVLVHLGDHVGGEVDHALQILRGDVQQVAEAGRHTLEEPDVRHRGGELDVAHALTAHAAAGHFDTAVTGRAEDLFAEQTVLLRLQRTVVDGFRLLDLTVAPTTDVIGGGKADANLVKCVDVQHLLIRFCS